MKDSAFGLSNNIHWTPVLYGQLAVSKRPIKLGKGCLT